MLSVRCEPVSKSPPTAVPWATIWHHSASSAARLTLFETLGTLFSLIAPWRRQMVLTVTSGVGRVYALIGVSTLSALTVAAIKMDSPFGAYLAWMAALVPLAGFLRWNES